MELELEGWLMPQVEDESRIVRVDHYTISVDGARVRATQDQERRIRMMDSATLERFLWILGAGRDEIRGKQHEQS
jgi:hypothetical protein